MYEIFQKTTKDYQEFFCNFYFIRAMKVRVY